MSNGVAVVALTYDGDDIQESDLGIHLEIIAGLDDSPDIRGVDVTVPYLDGKVVQPRRFDHRRILLEGIVQGVSNDASSARADYRANRRALSVLFDNTRLPATLRAVLEDGDITRIEARPLSIIVVEVVPGYVGTVSVELEAVSEWEGLGS